MQMEPHSKLSARELLLIFVFWTALASLSAINQLLDSRIDAQMARTAWRPLVSGTLTPRQYLRPLYPNYHPRSAQKEKD